jgi:hypothetical protein
VTLFKDIEDDLRNNTLRVVPFPDAFTVGVNIIAYTNTSASAMVKKFISLAKSTFDVHR